MSRACWRYVTRVNYLPCRSDCDYKSGTELTSENIIIWEDAAWPRLKSVWVYHRSRLSDTTFTAFTDIWPLMLHPHGFRPTVVGRQTTPSGSQGKNKPTDRMTGRPNETPNDMWLWWCYIVCKEWNRVYWIKVLCNLGCCCTKKIRSSLSRSPTFSQCVRELCNICLLSPWQTSKSFNILNLASKAVYRYCLY